MKPDLIEAEREFAFAILAEAAAQSYDAVRDLLGTVNYMDRKAAEASKEIGRLRAEIEFVRRIASNTLDKHGLIIPPALQPILPSGGGREEGSSCTVSADWTASPSQLSPTPHSAGGRD